jgi:Pyridoxamine 5'-phosphate oxidase
MTFDNPGWSLLDRGGRLETLDREECRRLLGSTNVGRFGYCTDFGPRIVPMNYTLVSEALTFRTGIDTEASHQLFDHPIAFEVDQVDGSFRRDGAFSLLETPSPSTKSHYFCSTSGNRRSLGRKADEPWSCSCRSR